MSGTPLPVVLIPGLAATPRFYAAQLDVLWRHGPLMVADHRRDDTMAAIARRILEAAPPRFALAGHSMGGYVALEILRQAAPRVAKLALLDTSAMPDLPEQSEKRRRLIALAEQGKYAQVPDLLFPLTVHPSRQQDAELLRIARLMAEETGAAAFVRQQQAILARADSRPGLAAIACPTLVVVGDTDQLTPPARAEEMASGIRGARLVVLKDCGHLCALERPQETTRALEEWLGG